MNCIRRYEVAPFPLFVACTYCALNHVTDAHNANNPISNSCTTTNLHKTTDPTEPNIAAFYEPSVINGCKERHYETDNWCDCLKANVENGEKFFSDAVTPSCRNSHHVLSL